MTGWWFGWTTHLKKMRKANWITFQSSNGEIEKYLSCHHLDEFMSFKPTLHNKKWAENQFHAIKLHDMKTSKPQTPKLVKRNSSFLRINFLKLPAFKKKTYLFLQLRCLVFFNSFGMRIADFQRNMKYKNIMHGLMHAVLFGGILTYPRLDWHAFLWTKKSFQWHIHIFFQGNPPSVWEWDCVMWPCHVLILKNVVNSINLEQKDMFVVVVAVDAAKLPLLQRRSRLKQDWIWGLKSRVFLRKFPFLKFLCARILVEDLLISNWATFETL